MDRNRKWAISAGTICLLQAAGLKITEFDRNRGFGVTPDGGVVVVDSTILFPSDTMWFDDAASLEKFSNKIGQFKLGHGALGHE